MSVGIVVMVVLLVLALLIAWFLYPVLRTDYADEWVQEVIGNNQITFVFEEEKRANK